MKRNYLKMKSWLYPNNKQALVQASQKFKPKIETLLKENELLKVKKLTLKIK